MNTQRQQFTFQRAKTVQGLQGFQNLQSSQSLTSPRRRFAETTNQSEISNQNNENKTEESNQSNNSSTPRRPLFQRQRTKTVSFGKGVLESPVNDMLQEENNNSNDNLPTVNNNQNNINNQNNNMNNNQLNQNNRSNVNHFNNFNQSKQPAYSTPSSANNSTPSSLRSSAKDTTITPVPTNSNRITFAHKPMKLHSSQPQSPGSPLSETNSSLSSTSISQSHTPSQLTQSSRAHGNVGFGANFQNQNKPKTQPRVTIGTKTLANRSSATSIHITNTHDENGKIVPSNNFVHPVAKKIHFSSSQLSLTSPPSPGLQSWVSPSAPQPKSQQFSYIQKDHQNQQYKNPEIYLRELELKTAQLRRIAQQQQIIIDNLRQKLHYNN